MRVFEWWRYGWHTTHNRNSDGNLYVRYLIWNGGHWKQDNNWLNNNFDSDNPSTVAATLFILSQLISWESFVL